LALGPSLGQKDKPVTSLPLVSPSPGRLIQPRSSTRHVNEFIRSLANEKGHYQEIDGVLMLPETPYQRPQAGYQRHGTPFSVQ